MVTSRLILPVFSTVRHTARKVNILCILYYAIMMPVSLVSYEKHKKNIDGIDREIKKLRNKTKIKKIIIKSCRARECRHNGVIKFPFTPARR